MACTLRSADKILISIDPEFSQASSFVTNMMKSPEWLATTPPIDVPASGKILQWLVITWRGYLLEDPQTLEAEAAYCKQYLLAESTTTIIPLLQAVSYLEMHIMLRVGCLAVAEMMRGCSQQAIRLYLGLQPESPVELFACLPSDVRRKCYDYFTISPEIILSFYEAIQNPHTEDLAREYSDWLKSLMELSSESRKRLQQLAPESILLLVQAGKIYIADKSRRKGHARDDAGDHWRPTELREQEYNKLPVDHIDIEDASALPNFRCSSRTFSVLCSRQDLQNFSQTWILFWTTSVPRLRFNGDSMDLGFVIQLFKGIKPDYQFYDYGKQFPQELKRSGAETLRIQELLSFFSRMLLETDSGYPPANCLQLSVAAISSILAWYDDSRARYMCGNRLEKEFLEHQRQELIRIQRECKRVFTEHRREGKKCRPLKPLSREKRMVKRNCKASVRQSNPVRRTR